MTTIKVKVAGGKNFGKGVKYAKQFGGKFDATTKTWDIPTHRNGVYNNACNALQIYHLIPVTDEQAGHDGACPGRWGGACECRE